MTEGRIHAALFIFKFTDKKRTGRLCVRSGPLALCQGSMAVCSMGFLHIDIDIKYLLTEDSSDDGLDFI